MKVLIVQVRDKPNHKTPTRQVRELVCLRATALDAAEFPILAKHWPGFLLIDGELAANDNSPALKRWEASNAEA